MKNYIHKNNNHEIIFYSEIAYLDCRKLFLEEYVQENFSFEFFVEKNYVHRFPGKIKSIKHINPISKNKEIGIKTRWEILDL